jgi:hypothetical protein
MARNETRNTEASFVDRAHAPARGDAWQTLTSACIASLLIAAIAVSACTLLDAVVARPKQRFAVQGDVPSLGTRVRFDTPPSTRRRAPASVMRD